jgi:sialidase-1
MNRKPMSFLAAFAVCLAVCLAVVIVLERPIEAADPQIVDVFARGTDGYCTFCIPAVVCTPKGTLLAFCEGRKVSGADESPTDLVLKRSSDGGKTWGPLQVIVKAVPAAAADATPVIDRVTGEVLLSYELWPELVKEEFRPEHMKRAAGFGRDSVTAWVMTSRDEGATWSTPVDITRMAKRADWTRIVHGPGVGIQMRSGRLVIPCWRTDPSDAAWNYVTFSDDHGKTWQLSDNEVGPGVNESQLVELEDRSLLLNMRSSTRSGCRVGATSADGGKTWSKPFQIPDLPDSCCQGSILRYTWADRQGSKSRILFSNPATKEGRHTGTVRLSYDEGKTWPVSKVIHRDTFAYSCLTVMPDGRVGCLFDHADWSRVKFASFSLEWLSDGKDTGKRGT